jgi:hypothetical protein
MLAVSRFLFATILSLGAGLAAAQNAKPPAAAAQPKPGQMTIDGAALAILIKGTVMALHQANVTGNYSVLRDLGTPIFRERFDQTALANAFANLRARKVNLGPALLVAPNLTKNPELNQNGELVLVGDFPTQPLQIHFELLFLQLDGVWRLAGLAVDAVLPPGAQAAAALAQQPAAPAAPQQPAAGQKNDKPSTNTKPKS